MIVLDTSACINYLDGNEKLKEIIFVQESIIYITAIYRYWGS